MLSYTVLYNKVIQFRKVTQLSVRFFKRKFRFRIFASMHNKQCIHGDYRVTTANKR